MRLQSDLSEVKEVQPLPNGIYTAHVYEKKDTTTRETNNPMAVLHWVIEDGPDGDTSVRDRKVMFDNVILGGKNKLGDPINPFRLANLLSATEIPWECVSCHNGEEARPVYIGRGNDEDGLVKGKSYCPDCKSDSFNITYDTDNFLAARCRLVLSIRKVEGKDREVNEIARYLPID